MLWAHLFQSKHFFKLISCLQHFPGNLAVILGNHPNLGPDGQRSDVKAFRVLVLVTPGQKSGKGGELSELWLLLIFARSFSRGVDSSLAAYPPERIVPQSYC